MTELQAIDIDDFTGGLNRWRNQFSIERNESPLMLNMEIDPRGGFYTRKGWSRWNSQDAMGERAHFDFPGTAGNYVTVPDESALRVAGDIEIVVRVALDDWTSGSGQTLVAKSDNLTSGDRGYSFSVTGSGLLRATVGDTVPTARTHTSSVVPTLVDGTTYWLKMTYELDDGANRRIKFYQAADQATEPSVWTQIGTDQTGTQLTAITHVTQPVRLGTTSANSHLAAGKFYRAIVRDGIAGTTVFDTGGDDIPYDTSATSYETTSGQTATIVKSGASYIVREDWEPRNTFFHLLSTGGYVVYVANNDLIEAAPSSAVFATLAIAGPTYIVPTASPHLADFAAWGDYVYIACGNATATYLRNGTGTPTAATDAYGNYNDDYTTPDAIGSGAMPRCEFIETHGGYIFCAYTKEGTVYPNRLRWSHPSQPENWATNDFLDIESGGGKITGLRSFQDHLLIFKTDSVWALYGYDSESWQLVRVSATAGAPSTTAITASETAVYFFSSAQNGTIFAYNGGGPPVLISQNLRTVLEDLTTADDVWLAWAGKRLWCSLPWTYGGAVSDQSTAFVFDPQVGNGAWTAHRPALGHVKSIVENADASIGAPLAVICGCSGAAALVKLDFNNSPVDTILEDLTLSPADCYYYTGWQHAGWPERRKSWRRPRFVVDQVDETVEINLDTYFDYDEASPMRSHILTATSRGTAFWRETGSLETNGFEWGDGTLWGEGGAEGSEIVRGVGTTQGLSGLGVNRAVQLKFSTNAEYAGKAWGVNLITLKYILRRFTT